MSTSIKIIEVKLDSYTELEETCENLIERLAFFKSKHPEFSFDIEKHYDTNTLVVKNCNLHEQVN